MYISQLSLLHVLSPKTILDIWRHPAFNTGILAAAVTEV